MSRNVLLIILMLICICIFVGCNVSSKKHNSEEGSDGISELLSELDKLGYYKYISDNEKNQVKEESKKAGYLFGWEESGRDFTSDAENLAEGGVLDFFEEIKPALARMDIQLDQMKTVSFGNEYIININGQDYTIYSENEVDSKNLWELSTYRSFALLNKLLKDKGSDERVYILYGGNDLRAVFLTSQMYEVIKRFEGYPEKEKPVAVPEIF